MSYSLKYDLKIEPKINGFEKEDVAESGEGLTDALVLISIIRDGIGAHNGATSHMIMSIDGHNDGKPIPDTELFTAFMILASHLNESASIPTWERLIAKAALQEFREAKGIKIVNEE